MEGLSRGVRAIKFAGIRHTLRLSINSYKQNRATACGRGAVVVAAALSFFLFISGARSQQVLAPPPVYSTSPPAVQEYETNQVGMPQVEQLAPANSPEEDPLKVGPVVIHPHPIYRFLYGNGIQATPGQQENTVINQITPGVLFAIGSHWTLDYSPTLTYYSSSQFRNTVDESVGLRWGTLYQDWVLGFSQSYVSSSAPTIQTGTQTDTETYTTAANATYRFNSEMSVDLTASQNFQFADQFTTTRTWSTMDWLNFLLWTRADIGVGAGFDYNELNPGPDVVDEQIQARIRWRLTDKASFALHGGPQDQQYLTNGGGSRISFVFGAAVEYRPVDTTEISLSADRSTTPSLFQGQVVETTSVSLGVNQRLLKKLNLGLTASYGDSTYLNSAPGVSTTNRVDTYYSFGARLSTTVLKRGTAAVFYQYSDNSSDVAGFGYVSSQVGLELGYRL